MDLSLLPPDINASDVEFTIEHNSIRFGLSAIKNVGTAAIESILGARNGGGAFVSLTDVVKRVDTTKVNKKTFECLIRTGAMDAFGNRAQLLAVLEDKLAQSHKDKRAAAAGQTGLFDIDEETKTRTNGSDHLPVMEELPKEQLLAFEKDLLGFYLTEHPLARRMEAIRAGGSSAISDITRERVGENVRVGGMVIAVKQIVTKAGGQPMAFVRLGDMGGTIEVVVFPKVYARTIDVWHKDMVVMIGGRVDEKDDRLTILVDEATLVV